MFIYVTGFKNTFSWYLLWLMTLFDKKKHILTIASTPSNYPIAQNNTGTLIDIYLSLYDSYNCSYLCNFLIFVLHLYCIYIVSNHIIYYVVNCDEYIYLLSEHKDNVGSSMNDRTNNFTLLLKDMKKVLIHYSAPS